MRALCDDKRALLVVGVFFVKVRPHDYLLFVIIKVVFWVICVICC